MFPPLKDAPVAGPVPPPPDLASMRAKFTADFTGGRIGRHHNTFQHRARVLRQLAAAERRAAGSPGPVPANPIFEQGA